jgi:hypothetical protein
MTEAVRTKLEQIIVLSQAALAELEPASDLDRVMALAADGKSPSIAAIKSALGCSQGKASRLRASATARLAEKGSSRELAANSGSAPEPAAKIPAPVQADEPGTIDIEVNAPTTDGSDEAKAFAIYKQCAKLQGWPDAGSLSNHLRFLIAARLAEADGLKGFTAMLSKASVAAVFREADGRTPKRFVTLGWLVERDIFTRIMEDSFRSHYKPGILEKPIRPAARHMEAREVSGADVRDAGIDR